MAERVFHIHSSGPSPDPLRIRVERGQRGGYAFEAIRLYLQESGSARRRDLEIELHYGRQATLYRLSLLKERGCSPGVFQAATTA